MFQNILSKINNIDYYIKESDYFIKRANDMTAYSDYFYNELSQIVKDNESCIKEISFYPRIINIQVAMNEALQMACDGDIILSSGERTHWYLDFMNMYYLTDKIYFIMQPKYCPVGILSGGGMIVQGAFTVGNCSGMVDVKKGIFYPPERPGSFGSRYELSLIDDVFTTGHTMYKAREIINNFSQKKGVEYVIKEQKVLLYRTDIPTTHDVGKVESLFTSVQLKEQHRPNFVYTGRK